MDYEYVTTFWEDFSIAEIYGIASIDETAKRIFNEWKSDIIYLTELIMILNHKCWYYYSIGDEALSQHYSDLYYKYNELALNYLEEYGSKEDINYYYKTLD